MQCRERAAIQRNSVYPCQGIDQPIEDGEEEGFKPPPYGRTLGIRFDAGVVAEDVEDGSQDEAQETPHACEDETEVVAGSGEDGVGVVIVTAIDARPET